MLRKLIDRKNEIDAIVNDYQQVEAQFREIVKTNDKAKIQEAFDNLYVRMTSKHVRVINLGELTRIQLTSQQQERLENLIGLKVALARLKNEKLTSLTIAPNWLNDQARNTFQKQNLDEKLNVQINLYSENLVGKLTHFPDPKPSTERTLEVSFREKYSSPHVTPKEALKMGFYLQQHSVRMAEERVRKNKVIETAFRQTPVKI
jgi:hypothetical protein